MPEQSITSRSNPRLQNARNVRDGKVSGRMFVEGQRLFNEALRSGVRLEEVFITTEFGDSQPMIAAALNESEALVTVVSEKAFPSITDTKTPQGIAAIAKTPVSKDFLQGELGEIPVAMYLHEVNNPSNLGAIFRSAEAAGVRHVATSPNSTAAFSPKSIRSSMGSIFRLQITESLSFEDAISTARSRGMMIYSIESGGGTDIYQIDWKAPSLLVFGSEAHGLPEELSTLVDKKLTIPMSPSVESLNLSVACGVTLFEIRRQIFDPVIGSGQQR